MRTTQRFFYFLVFAFLFMYNMNAQVTGLNFQMKYDTVECRHDFYIILNSGSATILPRRIQGSAQYSIVTPAAVQIVGKPINHMPLQNNQNYTGTIPTVWSVASTVFSPAADVDHNFFGITPSGSPTSLYNNIAAGDTIKLFSLEFAEFLTDTNNNGVINNQDEATPITTCGADIRIFRNPTFPDGSTNPNGDPDSSQPGMDLADFSNGFTIGGFQQLYENTSDSVGIPPIEITAMTTCNTGLEIDLEVDAISCHEPFTYNWEGPAGFVSTDEDVLISDATAASTGTYMVTVTGSMGCEAVLSIDAEAKPNAGDPVDGCVGTDVNLVGSDPTTGTWSSMAGNDSEATLNPGAGGMATVSLSGAASGNYNYIYSTDNCSDTTSINVITPDAGPDPVNVSCFSAGTATMNASGSGTWSIGAGSVGTATITDETLPNTTVTGFSDPGTYFLVWTVGPCSDIVEITTTDNCGCPIQQGILPSLNNIFCDNSDIVSIDGPAATPVGGIYLWEYNMNGASFSAAPGTNNLEDYNTQDLGVGVHSFRRIYETTTDFLCKDTTNTVSFEVINSPGAPLGLSADPNPLCLGSSSTISVTNDPNATYTWTASSPDAGLEVSTTNEVVITPTVDGVYDINVTQTINGCESVMATMSITVNITPGTPNANNIFGTSPTACAINDGYIRFVGLVANAEYTIDYLLNGVAQSLTQSASPVGEIRINNLGGGVFTDFVITNEVGCSSGLYAGPITLSEPDAPAAPDSIRANPNPECMGQPITISVVGVPGATFNWTSDSPDVVFEIPNNQDTVIMTSNVAGLFNISVTQSLNGCVSDVVSIGVSVTEAPPVPSDITSVNPSECGGSDGNISIGGLNNLTTYTVSYSRNGSVVTVDLQTNTNGILIIPGLSEGSYSNFSLTNITGCQSGEYVGPVSLSDPGSPDAPSGLLANPNPVCMGTEVALSVTNNPNATYTWSASSPDAGLVISNGNTTTLNATAPGTFTISVSQTVAGCTSPTATVDVVVGDTPPTPTAASVSFVDLLSCGGSNGSITLAGYNSNILYTVVYDKNSSPVSQDIMSNANGMIVIAGLSAGIYENLSVANSAGCTSGVYAGPIELMDPNAPDAPTNLVVNPNPVCAGEVVSLSVDNNPAAEYTWMVSPSTGAIVSSVTNTTTMTPPTAGVYTISVLQTIGGCTSPVTTVDLTVNPVPPAAKAVDVVVINPSSCGGSDGEFTIGGYIPNVSYNLTYEFEGNPVTVGVTANGSGEIFVTALSAGSYSNIIIANAIGCSSEPFVGPISLSDPGAPDAPRNLDGVPNPVCIGSMVDLSVEQNGGAIFTWTSSDPDAGLSTSTGNTTTMSPNQPGTYTISVVQSVDGCLSPAAMIDIIVSAIPPTPTDNTVSSTNPLVCGVNDGTITLSGYESNVSYQIDSRHNGQNMSLVYVADNSGNIILTGLAPGVYENFFVVSPGGCFSAVYPGPITLDGPDVPDAPTGLTGVPNPVCLGETINFNVDNEPNATYLWIASSFGAGLVASSTNMTSMLATVAGTYTIEVSLSINGCESLKSSMEVEVLDTPSTPTASSFVLEEPDCGGVNGSIKISGYGVNSDYVLSYSFEGQTTTLELVSNDQGELSFGGLGAGFYSDFMIVGEGGCASGIYAGPVELEEPCAGSVGSFVWHDINGNGVFNNSEPGIEDVEVILFTEAGEYYATTYTDGTGYYLFEEVLAGDYYIRFVAGDLYEPTIPNVGNELNDSDVDDTNGVGTTANFTVVSNQDLKTVKAGYYICSRIGDNVWYDFNENDLFDDIENGINGLLVNLYKKENGTWIFWENTRTTIKPESNSDDGWFEFCVAPGTYYVEILEPLAGLVLAKADVGNNDQIDSDFRMIGGTGRTNSFSLSSGDDKLDIGAGYYPEARAGNLVWIDANYNGLQDYDEEHLEGVVVQAYNAITQDMVGQSITDENGKYMIDEIQKMDIYLKFQIPANYTATSPDAGDYQNDSDVDHSNGENTTRTFSMQPGENNTHIDLGVSFAPLPVDWLFVGVSLEGKNHLIEWEVAQEINASHYEIERRLASELTYVKVSRNIIEAANSLQKTAYSYTDKDVAQSDKYYYRVKQIDRDGTFEYSEEVSIDGYKVLAIQMFPNPAFSSTSFEFSSKEEGEILVELFNADGKLVTKVNHIVQNVLVKEHFDLDISSLPQGVYNVVVKLNNSVVRKKLVKLN